VEKSSPKIRATRVIEKLPKVKIAQKVKKKLAKSGHPSRNEKSGNKNVFGLIHLLLFQGSNCKQKTF
jgi:hypothetical protein